MAGLVTLKFVNISEDAVIFRYVLMLICIIYRGHVYFQMLLPSFLTREQLMSTGLIKFVKRVFHMHPNFYFIDSNIPTKNSYVCI